MTTPVPQRTAAKTALKAFGITAAVVVVLDVAVVVLRLLNIYVPFLGIVLGWLLFFSVIGAIVSGIVVLVQRNPTSHVSSQRQSSQAPGLAPGWYPDQSDPNLRRYFDGRTWTSGTAPRE